MNKTYCIPVEILEYSIKNNIDVTKIDKKNNISKKIQ